jgi:CBS domain containing-hemolysin-like protein
MDVASWLLHPLTALLNRVGNVLLARIGIPPADTNARLISSAELAYIVEDSSEGGQLQPSEQVYLENVIDFHERNVGQVMTPRNRMAMLPLSAELTSVLDAVGAERHARYPVYAETRDEIVGILHIKDLARHLVRPDAVFSLPTLMRPAMFVPESVALDDMLAQFRAQHAQIAIVLDEYGGTAGVITLEDLAEELIGEILDMDDEELAPFVEIAPTVLRVRGDLLLDELTQHYDLEFDTSEAETVGGLIMALLGQVPQPGDEVTQGDIHFVVETTEGMAVAAALVYLPGQTPAATAK